MTEIMLTTKDNPYDYFERYEDWKAWDTDHDYGCEELIGRLAYSDSNASPASQQHEYESTIRDIIKNDPLGIYDIDSKEIED